MKRRPIPEPGPHHTVKQPGIFLGTFAGDGSNSHRLYDCYFIPADGVEPAMFTHRWGDDPESQNDTREWSRLEFASRNYDAWHGFGKLIEIAERRGLIPSKEGVPA